MKQEAITVRSSKLIADSNEGDTEKAEEARTLRLKKWPKAGVLLENRYLAILQNQFSSVYSATRRLKNLLYPTPQTRQTR